MSRSNRRPKRYSDRLFLRDLEPDAISLRSAKSGLSVATLAFGKAFVLIFSTSILARLIPPHEYSILALTLPIFYFATAISGLGLPQVFAQADHADHQFASHLFGISAISGIFFGVMVVASGTIFFPNYRSDNFELVLVALGAATILSTLSGFYLSIFWRLLRAREAEILTFLAVFTSSVLAVVCALLGAGFWSIVIQQLSLHLFTLTFFFFRLGWVPHFRLSTPRLELFKSVRLGLHLTVFALAFQFFSSFATLQVGRLFGDLQASFFFRSWNLSQMPSKFVSGPLSGTFVPSLSLLRGVPDDYGRFSANISYWLSKLFVPLGAVFVFFSNEVVRLYLGDKWIDAATMLSLIGFRVAFVPLSSLFRWILVSSGGGRSVSTLGLMLGFSAILLAVIPNHQSVMGFVILFVSLELFVMVAFAGIFVFRIAKDFTTHFVSVLINFSIDIVLYFSAAYFLHFLLDGGSYLYRLLLVISVFFLVVVLQILASRKARSDFLTFFSSFNLHRFTGRSEK